MVEVSFRYKDNLSRKMDDEWRYQECVVESVESCKKIYGLETDSNCEYEILSIKEI